MDNNSIERISCSQLGRLGFNLKYYLRNRPVIITDGADSWEARRKWSPAYLKTILWNKKTKINFNNNGVFDYNYRASTGPVMIREVRFTEAVDFILSRDGEKSYVRQESLKTHFPELFPDVAIPYLLDSTKRLWEVNLWFGGRGCKSQLHFDPIDNFLVQILGRKRVILLPPGESKNLYAARDSHLPHCSRLNIFNPDETAFPLYTKSRPRQTEVVLEPGNMLFLPAQWWHAVESLDVSISVNFWWSGIEKIAVLPIMKGIPRLFSKHGRRELQGVYNFIRRTR